MSNKNDPKHTTSSSQHPKDQKAEQTAEAEQKAALSPVVQPTHVPTQIEKAQRGGLDPNPATAGGLGPDNVEKALSPAGDTGKAGTTADDPSKGPAGSLDVNDVTKHGATTEGGAVSQTSSALGEGGAGSAPDGQGWDGKDENGKQVRHVPQVAADAPRIKSREKRFEVKSPQTQTVSWRGQEVRLEPGQVISEEVFGDGAVERFKQCGVKLEEYEETK